jgi:energy-coupling factor transport system permease protein
MSRISIGQFFPADSVIHRLDARVKLAGTIMYIAMLLMVDTLWGYGVAAVVVFSLVALSRVPFRMLLRALRPIIFILFIAAGINLFLTPGTEEIFRWWVFSITREGRDLAVQMALRLTLLVAGSQILTLTTSPIALTDGIEYVLGPLKIIRVPAHDIAMMMTIALRFIPTLADEMDKIMKAQKARGANFETGSIFKRAKSLVPVLVPLFVSAFKRADELATAMEARCYRGDNGRTKMKRMKMRVWDWISLVGFFAMGLSVGLLL